LETSIKEGRMPGTAGKKTNDEYSESGVGGRRSLIEELGRALDGWRARIYGLMDQLDLANLDVRDEFRQRLDTTQNVYLAARSLVSDAGHDAGSSLSSLRLDVEQLMGDLRYAHDAAEAVVRHGQHQQSGGARLAILSPSGR
jgi:hypothetical protein